ncbi:hypothetical protein A5787_17290 [Mycobacterium sp. 852002-50816_SCH5313054-b]|uniref:hypothetical protein n=1 Tax=Mycobacterium sp. 852002-50816_SCH5313054-b TaxID=1834092 RepID=UPI0007FEBBE1|nr:hypothetical protein [Mycobacterium sp. 852002-50816_SCH5313054-b]OBF61922.1 hypothetical protein A5787_17290 [Mycobacterium sp. 852002-50816_SCH5313054-b]
MNTTRGLDVVAPAAPKQRATGRPALVEHLRRLRVNAALFVSLAREAGIDTADSEGTNTIACIVGSSSTALRLSGALLRHGIYADAVRFPAVPEDQARLRFLVTSCHTSEQIRFTVNVLAEELRLLNAKGLRDSDFGEPR